MVNPTDLSERGLRMLCAMEAYVGHVYHGRADRPDVLTVGYGHVLTPAEKAAGTYANGLTRAEALELCKQDLRPVTLAVSTLVKVPISQAQFDALVSFAFNVGEGQKGLAGSTLLRKLNACDYIGAAAEFVRWDHANGVEDMGLKGRREGEARLFLEGMPDAPPTLEALLARADAQQFDLTQDLGLESPHNRDTLPEV